MMEEVSERVGMNYPEIPDSRYVYESSQSIFFTENFSNITNIYI